MSTLTCWDPFRELKDMEQRLSNFFGQRGHRDTGKESITVSEWAPVVNITEDEKGYVVEAELADIKGEQIKVTMENGMLVISGERTFDKEQGDRRYHRIERSYGKFGRSFVLPDDADSGNVQAEFKEGLLRVRVSKSEAAQPKQIEVKVG